MRRVRNWDVSIVQFAKEVVGKPFVWGETDCASLLYRVYEIMHGQKPDVVLRYTTAKGALSAHQRTGGTEKVVRDLGALDIERPAKYGDIIFYKGPEEHPWDNIAIYVPPNILIANEKDGIKFVSRNSLDMEHTTVLRFS